MTYNANMSPDDVIDMFELLVDDGPDADGVQVLMDSAYTLRNESRIWQMLMKLDSSITHSPSDLWTTEKSLPSDFGSIYKGYGGDGQNPYEGVPFEQILNYKGSSNRYTVDTARSKLRFMGPAGSALTFYMFYQYVPTSLIGLAPADLASTSTIVWPGRFRPLLAFDMAAMYFGGWDADEVTRQMTPSQMATAKNLERAMIKWDNRNRTSLMGNSSGPQPRATGYPADVVEGLIP